MSAQIVPFPGVRPDAPRKSSSSLNQSPSIPADRVVDQARSLLTAELRVIHTAPPHLAAQAAGSALLLASRMLLELSICLQESNTTIHWPMRREVRS